MKILGLVNPEAGSGKTLKKFSKMKKIIEESPHDFIWKIADSPEALREEILNARSSGTEGILLMGGDGTVHNALPAFRQIDLPFGILPCGRGNDFARNVGIPLDLKSNCAIAAEPIIHNLDLPLINDRPFGSVACIGFDAEVGKLAKNKKGYFGGTLGYIICVLRALKEFQPFEAEIKVNDFHWSGWTMMVAISNGPCYGGGMKIAPNACMDDGQFDVCIIQEVSKWELLQQFPKVFRGSHVTHPKVIMKSGDRVEVITDKQREIFADGEHISDTPCLGSIGNLKIHVIQPDK